MTLLWSRFGRSRNCQSLAAKRGRPSVFNTINTSDDLGQSPIATDESHDDQTKSFVALSKGSNEITAQTHLSQASV